MHDIAFYHAQFLTAIGGAVPTREPKGLYEPVNYILQLGGKRIRPILTMLSAELFGATYTRAMPAALAVELFHNFSLIHDDIMDQAPLRRGKETVHCKWDLNTGILSGDAMLILAYQYFEGYEPATFQVLAKLFSETALQVCEGQQWDVEFETRSAVSIQEYLRMIEYKTAVLLGAAMKMGAIVAGASQGDAEAIYHFGRLLGIAFQLQDDYLDSFGDPVTFGKQVGGDIIENKKTFLYLKAMAFANAEQKEAISELYATNDQQKVAQVKALFEQTGAAEAILAEVNHYTQQAFERLDLLSVGNQQKAVLRLFGEQLMNRIS